METFELKNQIKGYYFDYQKLISIIKDQKHPRRYIGQLLKKGYLVRVKKGLYIWGKNIEPQPYSQEVLANLIFGPSYVSLEYALSYYGLIPERVETVTSITFKRKKLFKTPVGQFSYEHLHGETYPQGIKLQIIDEKQSFFLATPEKALLDLIALRFEKTDFNFKDKKKE